MPTPARNALEDTKLVEASGYRIKYHPRGVICDLFTDHSDEILLVGGAGTGKSLGALHKIHLVLSKYPNSCGFMARKTRASMTNSCMKTFSTHVIKPPDKVHLHKQEQQYNYPNGSMLAIIGLDDPERIKSTDWDIGYIQEATECTENDIEICTTRLRNWKVPYQQLLMDCNPDRPKHWLHIRCEKGMTKELKSTHKDNPRLWDEYSNSWTKEGVAYLAKLQRLQGVRYKRLYLGEWAAAEGIVYDQWNDQIHLVSINDLPAGWDEWPHLWAIDWGYTHPCVWGDWIEDPKTGALYLYRQIYRTRTVVSDLAAEVMELTSGEAPPYAIICDHDSGDRAEFEKGTGLLTMPAYKNIRLGVQAVQKRLLPNWNNKPGLFIVRDSLTHPDDPELKESGKPCRGEEEWDGYVWDKKRNELVANSKRDELPIDKDNHFLDAARYAIAFVDNLADDPQEFEEVALYDGEVQISMY